MKTEIYIAIILALFVFGLWLMIPLSTHASTLQVKLVPQREVARACHNAKDYAPDLIGCYKWSRNKKTIYIDKTLRGEKFDFIFYHEYGHYLLNKNLSLWNGDEELMANEFSWWAMDYGWEPSLPKKEIFIEAIKDNEMGRLYTRLITRDNI